MAVVNAAICDFKGQGSDLPRHLVSAHYSVIKGQEKPGPRLGPGRRVDAGRGDVVKLTEDALDISEHLRT